MYRMRADMEKHEELAVANYKKIKNIVILSYFNKNGNEYLDFMSPNGSSNPINQA